MAHHADDLAETVLMRLATGQRSISLRAIRASAPIPECVGIHGVYLSGEYEMTEQLKSEENPARKEGEILQISQQRLSLPPISESGGVWIMRPLLGFHKHDLINICNAYKVEWFEDKTNKDFWRTPRNTIRGLLSSAKLPWALNKASLLGLSSSMQRRELTAYKCASDLLELCESLLFDMRSGGVVVRLPRAYFNALDKGGESKTLIASLFVRDLAMMVSPQADVPLDSLQNVVKFIFPEISTSKVPESDRMDMPARFTAAGVQFERLDAKASSKSPQTNLDSGVEEPGQDSDPGNIWCLTRQPFSSTTLTAMSKGFTDAPTVTQNTNIFPPSSISASGLPTWSSWHLWDSRYWIRISNHTGHPLVLRPFCPSDLENARSNLAALKLKPLEEALAAAAPKKVRWTLPVIAQAVEGQNDQGKVLVLPSLGKPGILEVDNENGERSVQWEIRYKYVRSRAQKTVTSWVNS